MTISDAEYEAANKVGAKMMKRGPIVVFAAYDPASRTLLMTFANGTALTTPVDNVQGLADADDADLALIEIASLGLGLHWPRLDADVWVPDLLEGVTGTRAWLAARGGAAKSEGQGRRRPPQRPEGRPPEEDRGLTDARSSSPSPDLTEQELDDILTALSDWSIEGSRKDRDDDDIPRPDLDGATAREDADRQALPALRGLPGGATRQTASTTRGRRWHRPPLLLDAVEPPEGAAALAQLDRRFLPRRRRPVRRAVERRARMGQQQATTASFPHRSRAEGTSRCRPLSRRPGR